MRELVDFPPESELEEYPEEKTDWVGSYFDDEHPFDVNYPQPTWEDGYTRRVSLRSSPLFTEGSVCDLFYSKNRIRLLSKREDRITTVTSSPTSIYPVEIPTPDLPFGIRETDTFEEALSKLEGSGVSFLINITPVQSIMRGEVVLKDGVVTYKTSSEDIVLEDEEPTGLTLDFSKLDLEDTGESDLE